jgi:disulfide bond formation protein DsbB
MVGRLDAPAETASVEGPLAEWAPYFALVVAWTAFLGSLYFSEVNHFIPCALCWYQRILMYPIALIIPIGLLRRDSGMPLYVIPLAVVGAAVATYHVLLQKTDWFSETNACQVGVPCSSDYINWLGFITIPTLALTAFILIILAMSAARRSAAATWAVPGPRPALRVAVTIAAVIAFYGAVYYVTGPHPAVSFDRGVNLAGS